MQLLVVQLKKQLYKTIQELRELRKEFNLLKSYVMHNVEGQEID